MTVTVPEPSTDVRYDLIYREWEYRHRVFWSSFNLWGLLVAICGTGPFLKPELLNLGWSVLIIPCFGMFIALFASIHLLGEAARMGAVFQLLTYRSAQKRIYRDFDVPNRMRLKHKLQLLQTAKVMSNLFLYVLVPFCMSSTVLITLAIIDRVGSPFEFTGAGFARFLTYLTAAALPIGGLLLGARRALKATEPAAQPEGDVP